jgi:hypothetical protein
MKKNIEVIEFDTDAIKAREDAVAVETDDEIVARLRERFTILTDMTKAVKSGDVRAMIVSGPPGVGKSFGVEEVLSKQDLFTNLAGWKPKYEIVKGTMSSVGLYAKLHEFSEAGSVVVFDDCDGLFYDMLSLNILKAALDTGSKRYISWNTDSRLLRSEGIPDRFEFKGSAIFITNIKFSHVRSKTLKGHLNALESRCHYIDLEMDTAREKMLRIKQIVGDGMLDKYNFGEDGVEEIMKYVEDNKSQLRELSLRMVLKIADLRKGFPASWQAMAKTTCMASR